MGEPVHLSASWVVEEADEPLAGAQHHWVMTPRDPSPEGVTGLRPAARDSFWEALGWLKAAYGLTYYCLAARSWDGGAVEVVVAEKHPPESVRLSFGFPPVVEPVEVQS